MNQVDKELMQEKGILTENEKADEYEIQKAAMKEAVFFLAAMLEKNLDMSELQTISLYLKELSMKQHYMHIHLYVQQLYRNSRGAILMRMDRLMKTPSMMMPVKQQKSWQYFCEQFSIIRKKIQRN